MELVMSRSNVFFYLFYKIVIIKCLTRCICKMFNQDQIYVFFHLVLLIALKVLIPGFKFNKKCNKNLFQ